jgi:hypothetical protein
VLSASFSPAGAAAQTLRGLVIDQSTGAPVVLARVTLLDVVDSLPVAAALTDLAGYFSVTASESGPYWVSAEAGFYWTHASGPVVLTPEDTAAVGFTLLPRPVEVEGLVVEARSRARRMIQGGYYERRESGLGWHLDRDEIERRAPWRVSQALRAIPQLTLARAEFGDREPVFRGWETMVRGRPRATCYPRVYIDGIMFSPGGDMPTEIDRALRPDEVEAIEVFESPWIPGRFAGSLAPCGVIAVWRR